MRSQSKDIRPQKRFGKSLYFVPNGRLPKKNPIAFEDMCSILIFSKICLMKIFMHLFHFGGLGKRAHIYGKFEGKICLVGNAKVHPPQLG